MSVFDSIAGFFSGAVSSVVDLAKKAWGAVRTTWAFLVHVGGLVFGAWDWLVNGVEWFTQQVGAWAGEVYGTLWHTLTNVIPGAVSWAIRQAVKWAATAVHNTAKFLEGLVKNVATWALRELKKLGHTLRGVIASVVKWVTGPIHWVLTVGRHIANLVLHPRALAEWIVGALVVPLIMWILRSSAPIVAWFIKSFIARTGELVHLIEDVLARVV